MTIIAYLGSVSCSFPYLLRLSARIWFIDLYSRFVMSLCIPAMEMLLHAIIAGLLREDVKLFSPPGKNGTGRISRMKSASFWVMISRVALPIAFIIVALAIVLPGIINVVVLEYM